jgi:FkbM family methyltransferase
MRGSRRALTVRSALGRCSIREAVVYTRLLKRAIPSIEPQFSGRTHPMKDAINKGLDARLQTLEETVRGLSKAVERLTRRAEPFGVYMGDGTVLTQTIGGLRFYVPAGDTVIAPKMIGNRTWEPRVSSILERLVRKDRDFLDIGANIGYFSVLVASILGQGGGAVHAFEPNPEILELLRRNISINWSIAPIHVHPLAIGERVEQLELRIPGKLASNGSLIGKKSGDCVIHTVKVVPLTSLNFETGRVGLIKVDVEGAEPLVMAGALEFLRRNPDTDIIMEWDTAAQNQLPGGSARLLSIIKELNYKVWTLDKQITSIAIPALERLAYSNLLMSHRELTL